MKSGKNPRSFQSRIHIRDSLAVCIGRLSAGVLVGKAMSKAIES